MNPCFYDCLTAQARLHPALGPRDAVKLCYQTSFGAEHLLADPAGARAFLSRELAETPSRPEEALAEPIGPGFCRVNLAAWKARRLPEDWLFRLFLSSSVPVEGDISPCLRDVSAAAEAGALPFGPEEWNAFLSGYLAGGIRAVHHSETYRLAERPAYRVVNARYLPLLPVLERMAALPAGDGARVVAIDGRAAAGKSTLAGLLAQVTGAGLVHMDDFFLPPELRTPERLALPGGNVHHERFAAQVLPRLRCREAFSYPVWDCGRAAFGGDRTVDASPWRVVEGSYAQHPVFGDYADLRVFCTVSPEEQRARLLRREGPDYTKVFESLWIPLEEAYLSSFAVPDHADLTVEN